MPVLEEESRIKQDDLRREQRLKKRKKIKKIKRNLRRPSVAHGRVGVGGARGIIIECVVVGPALKCEGVVD